MSVPTEAVGAVVAAVGGAMVQIAIDRSLPVTDIRTSEHLDVGQRILLKGKGPSRGRYLDDPRNATKLGVNVARALAQAHPESAEDFAAGRAAFTRSFARDVFAWTRQAQRSAMHKVALQHAGERRYLLEWAGAVIDPDSRTQPPRALASLPAAPRIPTLAAYRVYIAALIAALG